VVVGVLAVVAAAVVFTSRGNQNFEMPSLIIDVNDFIYIDISTP